MPNPTGRTPAALNAAIKASRHPVVVRVDGHGMLSPNYIATAVRLLEETGAQNVGGIMHAEGENDWEHAVAAAMTSKIGVGNAAFHTGGEAGPAETVYLGVFRREVLEQQGGYNEEFIRAQDWELNFRIREAGGLIWFSPELQGLVPAAAERAGAGQAVQGLRPLAPRRRPLPPGLDQPALPRRRRPPSCAIAAGVVVGRGAHPAGASSSPAATSRRSPRARCPRARGCRSKARLQIPVALATMHMSLGLRLPDQPALAGPEGHRQPPPGGAGAPRPTLRTQGAGPGARSGALAHRERGRHQRVVGLTCMQAFVVRAVERVRAVRRLVVVVGSAAFGYVVPARQSAPTTSVMPGRRPWTSSPRSSGSPSDLATARASPSWSALG